MGEKPAVICLFLVSQNRIPTHWARQLLHDFSPLSLTRDGHCGGVEIGVADGLEQTISLPLANAVLNKSLLPDGVGEAIERGKRFAVLQNDVY